MVLASFPWRQRIPQIEINSINQADCLSLLEYGIDELEKALDALDTTGL
jgi:hypothetical protein